MEEPIKAAGCMIMHNNKVLLLKRQASADHAGCWAFPGGKVEDGESQEEAARRETKEETGYEVGDIDEISRTNTPEVVFTTYRTHTTSIFDPVLNEEHTEFMWAELDNLPDGLHPGAKKTLDAYCAAAMDSARQADVNGYITIKSNPISRAGIFQYMGKSIGAEEPDRVYNVYRPAEELDNPEAIASFKMIPLIDDHVMLGTSSTGFTPAEKKGVHGITGEEVVYRDGVLFANLKIFSQTLFNMIQQGKKDLSLGYRCVYEKASGFFNGQPYDYIQRKLRGNHLALVDQARCAVAVLDHHITFDHFDLTTHEKGEIPMTEEEKKAKEAADKAARDEAEAKEKADKQAADKKAADEAEEEEKKKEKEAADAAEKQSVAADRAELKTLRGEVADLKKNGIKTIMTEITARDALAKDLSNHIGTFDHSDKTLDEVAAYGVEKLGIECAKGHEHAALKGFMAAAGKRSTAAGSGMDAKPKSSEIGEYITKSA